MTHGKWQMAKKQKMRSGGGDGDGDIGDWR
jgi:hypothetical protein